MNKPSTRAKSAPAAAKASASSNAPASGFSYSRPFFEELVDRALAHAKKLGISADSVHLVKIDASYAGYLDRQTADAEAFRRDEDLRLPGELDYAAIGGLSNEVREKLAAVRPLTLGQAARIEGVTPGALTALLAHVRRRAA